MKKGMLIMTLISSLTASSLTSKALGSPLTDTATKVLFCGGGELGKEVVIELQRLGIETVVLDRYANPPAMAVAHRSHVLSMCDGKALREIIEHEKPHIIVPEIEAIATEALLELEAKGYTVIPTARAAHITMNRERIRRLAAEELGLKTSAYRFAQTYDEFVQAVHKLGLPCVAKPIMSSSGKGQTIIKTNNDIAKAWKCAQTDGRAQTGKVIIEEFIPFDFEITLLTVRDGNGNTYFCDPIGHKQINGDYRESWQPQPMSDQTLHKAHHIAKTVTDALGGRGIFGIELFIMENEVYFSEVSPRPHDTGMVTLISQDLSEFALHARALLGLPIPNIRVHGPSASHTLLVTGKSNHVQFDNLEVALNIPDTQLRLFGKPEVNGERRMGVALARGKTIEEARDKARRCIESIRIIL